MASVDDLRLAPFHLLATEGKVHVDRDHVWHMETPAKLCRADPKLLVATPFRVVNLADDRSREQAIGWWLELTTFPEHLERLRSRGLSAKRSLALRELTLGVEALERFVRREPLRRVHECVFGVLALESEPVDPRL